MLQNQPSRMYVLVSRALRQVKYQYVTMLSVVSVDSVPSLVLTALLELIASMLCTTTLVFTTSIELTTSLVLTALLVSTVSWVLAKSMASAVPPIGVTAKGESGE